MLDDMQAIWDHEPADQRSRRHWKHSLLVVAGARNHHVVAAASASPLDWLGSRCGRSKARARWRVQGLGRCRALSRQCLAWLVRAIALCCVGLLLGCGVAVRARPPTTPDVVASSGTLDAQGLLVDYATVIANEGLANAVVVGAVVLARSEHGAIVRFDDRGPPARRDYWPPVAGIAQDRQQVVYVALTDGTIGRLDVASLGVEPLARVAGKVLWLGAGADHALIVVAVDGDDVVAYVVAHEGSRGWRVTQRRQMPPAEVPVFGTRFLVDRSNRLWFGHDGGEWGGEAGNIDLATGHVTKFPIVTLPVRGFMDVGTPESPSVVIFGGLMHLSSAWTYLLAVDGATTTPTMWRERSLVSVESQAPTDLYTPDALASGGDAEFMAVVKGSLYRVDRSFQFWSAPVPLPSSRGAGEYPSANELVVIGPSDVLVVSRQDGCYRVRGEAVTHYELPSLQLPEVPGDAKGPAEVLDRGWRWRTEGTAISVSAPDGRRFQIPLSRALVNAAIEGLHALPGGAKGAIARVGPRWIRLTIHDSDGPPEQPTAVRH
ncbi:MAG: hypothetical protein R3B06_21340 [Kofleriaceae bacterium]